MSVSLSLRFAVLSFSVFVLFVSPADAATKKPTVYGDWTLVCAENKETKKQQCEIAQTQTMKNKEGKQGGRLLRLAIAKHKKDTYFIHALLPLGISLPSGAAIVVDENKQQNMVLQRCTNNGCEATMIADKNFISEMKKGKQVKIGFKVMGKTMVIPASLKGISKALRKLR